MLKREIKAPRFQQYLVCKYHAKHLLHAAQLTPYTMTAPMLTWYWPLPNADFTNLLSQVHLQELAEADAAKEMIQEVQVGIKH